MTPNYEDAPTKPPKKPGLPGWAWGLIGCAVISPLLLLILAAITFPVFAQAREKARQTSCLSNCKQMALGAMMYMQDYDEVMPPKGAKWMDLSEPYTKSPQVYRCPSYGSNPYGYAMNSEPLGKKLEKIKDMETLYLIFDSNVSRAERAGSADGDCLPPCPKVWQCGICRWACEDNDRSGEQLSKLRL
ncbi:MAG: DUF1559 domain-containing protein [Armatimonas sp.]